MWIFNDMAQLLMSLGILLAIIDVVFLGFATFFLTLIGLATLTTGVLIWLGVIDEQWTSITVSIALLSATYSAALWQPLKNLQQAKSEKKVSSDLTGHQFILDCDISPTYPGTYSYSGIVWKVESSEIIAAGTRVVVTDIQVGVMTVTSV